MLNQFLVTGPTSSKVSALMSIFEGIGGKAPVTTVSGIGNSMASFQPVSVPDTCVTTICTLVVAPPGNVPGLIVSTAF